LQFGFANAIYDGTKQQIQCFSNMVESAMYIFIGLLVGCLITLAVVPLVHERAVRLTVKQLEATLPRSLDEIRADKDLLRAEFAMLARRMQTTIEQLRNKTTSQLAELGRMTDIINRLKTQRDDLRIELLAATARAAALKKQLAEHDRSAGPNAIVRNWLDRWVPHDAHQ